MSLVMFLSFSRTVTKSLSIDPFLLWKVQRDEIPLLLAFGHNKFVIGMYRGERMWVIWLSDDEIRMRATPYIYQQRWAMIYSGFRGLFYTCNYFLSINMENEWKCVCVCVERAKWSSQQMNIEVIIARTFPFDCNVHCIGTEEEKNDQ